MTLALGSGLDGSPPSAAAQTTFTSSGLIYIPDGFGPASLYPTKISVSGLSGTITQVAVSLNGLSHGNPADIDMLLVGPTGAAVILMSDVSGGGNDISNVDIIICDCFIDYMPQVSPLESGQYRPSNYNYGTGDSFPSPAPAGPYGATLSAFNGTNPNGDWSLYLNDDDTGGTGALSSWQISLSTTNAATYTNGAGASIPTIGFTSGTASPYPSTLNVSGLQGSVTEVVVQIDNLTHTYPDDIDMLLVGPTGANVVLMSDAGGGFDLVNVDLVFWASAAFPILPDDTQIPPGIYRPTNYEFETFAPPAPNPYSNGSLDQFYGIDPNGTCSLYVQDDAAQDRGSFAGWSLTITFTAGKLFSGLGVLIPGDDPVSAAPYPSNISVAGLAGPTTKVVVTLSYLNHDRSDDLDILLVGPTGANAIIMSDAGDGANNVYVTFDDNAGSLIPSFGSLFTGIFKPTNNGGGDTFRAPAPVPSGGSALSIFNGTSPNGLWSLYVMDDSGRRFGGVIGGWSLTITTAPPTTAPTQTSSPTITQSASPTSSPSRTPSPSSTITLTPTRSSTPTATLGTGVPSATPTFVAGGQATLNGSVALEGLTPGTGGYQVSLVVRLLQPGTESQVSSFGAMTDVTGAFSVSGLPAGTFDIDVKNLQRISRRASGVTLTNGGVLSRAFGLLLAGDVNNSNFVNLSDYNLLRAAFLLSQGDKGYNPQADFNGSGFVNLSDYNLLRANFLVEGPLPAGP